MSLNDIVQVTITTATSAPSRVGFGIPLVMAYHTNWPERAREYTEVADMVTDGFAATDPAVLAVTALLAQNPKPQYVVVGREENTSKMKINLVPTAQNSTDYTVYLNGNEATFTSDATATVAEITAGLKTKIDLLGESVTVTDNTTDLDIEADTVADQFSFYTADRTLIDMNDVTPDAGGGIADDIAKVRIENDDWYTCHLTTQGKDVIKAAAAHIETLYKMLVVSSPDTDIYDGASTTDVAYELQAAGYARTALMYHYKSNVQFPACAWAGRCLPKDPGSITWKFKTLSGVDYMSFTTTEESAIEAKDCNMYVRIAGLSMAQEGVTSSGEFIDVIRGTDFIRARLQEYIFAVLKNADKIPFTNAGISTVVAEVLAVLRLAVGNGILTEDPAPTVQAPLASAVSAADKASRLLPDVKFTGTLAGAIHATQISGTISV